LDCRTVVVLEVNTTRRASGDATYAREARLMWRQVDDGSEHLGAVVPWREYEGNAPVPFGAFPVWTVAGSRLYVGASNRFEIRVYDRDRGLERVLRWSSALARVSAADEARFNARREELIAADPALGTVLPVMAGASEGRVRPAIGRIEVDDSGRIWVEAYAEAQAGVWENAARSVRAGDGEGRWWLFDRAGTWLGWVAVPDGLTLGSIRGDVMVGVFRDERGNASIRAYRFVPTQ